MRSGGSLADPNLADSLAAWAEGAGLVYQEGKDSIRTVQNVFVSTNSACSQCDFFISQYPDGLVVDLCNVESEHDQNEVPFKIRAELAGVDEEKERVPVVATVDGGAMLSVLDFTIWGQVEQSLGALRPSPVVCRMANGACTPSKGTGQAWIGIAGVWRWVQFEVLDSCGAFELLLGKTWLRQAGASHDFASDTLKLRTATGVLELLNEHPEATRPRPLLEHPQEDKYKPKPELECEPSPIPGPESEPDAKPKIELKNEHEPEYESAVAVTIEESEAEDEEESSQGPQVESALGESKPRRSTRIRERNVRATQLVVPYWLDEEAVQVFEDELGVQLEAELELDERAVDVCMVETLAQTPGKSEAQFVERMWRLGAQEAEEERIRQMLLIDNPSRQIPVHTLEEVIQRAERART